MTVFIASSFAGNSTGSPIVLSGGGIPKQLPAVDCTVAVHVTVMVSVDLPVAITSSTFFYDAFVHAPS